MRGDETCEKEQRVNLVNEHIELDGKNEVQSLTIDTVNQLDQTASSI
jgi:hypothetical protein